ncbi:hypothetical protein GE21DRAFT_3438 [Neurospora crassa]|uniref:Uncharacterized protein B24G3.190 n=1 Tax=Neurospora crassa (strain ATCC 24698 / 74-OR23-1A / CBS 708.71 / DSM 1257 / FGSC 987) TaxID=367110 RepID=YBG3_NEUCR|nr:uncharacterized protein NCU01548 [Neurospora crassa OR74A]Q8WZY3.1 RecName: Full=Uncharacterized protein B24G3.190; Flags: Precursor [Neurospora crassa OR74A]ESA43668.1 hypothetical protein, variant [Neurospora crassa OR74A]KHE87193.1 hypothetical protein GE21DRAFT_3438 [Neurospora crassa]CAD21234.1 related to serine proteinase inhibitor IA-2 [Neurospora crassa]|eukprot:XP_011393460.1 uncharacterized protein NCU01548 [Neurospora crassa OR74A]
MKFSGLILGALALVSGAIAVDIQKSVIITYKENTPDSVIQQDKKAILDDGGVITHEYTLMKGFSAKVNAKTLESVSASSESYATIEEDKVVSTL